jgi:hypothetical protein
MIYKNAYVLCTTEIRIWVTLAPVGGSLRSRKAMFCIWEQCGSSPSKWLFNKSRNCMFCVLQTDAGTRSIMLFEDRIRNSRFGDSNSCGKRPDRRFVEMSNVLRLQRYLATELVGTEVEGFQTGKIPNLRRRYSPTYTVIRKIKEVQAC